MPTSRTYLFELWLAASAAGGLIGRRLEPFGVEAHLFALLSHIADREPVAPSVIAAEEGIPATTIRDNVQRLVDRGLVERLPNPEDGRSYLLVRTPAGATALEVGSAVLGAIYDALDGELPRAASEYDAMLIELREAISVVVADASATPARDR